MTAVKAGTAYFALVFTAGFALGVVRVLLLAPRIGIFFAVLLELPVILTVSWIACGWILKRFAVSARADCRLVMGGVAFVLLIAAEVMLASAFGSSPSAYLSSWATREGALGLAGQMVFALFPWVMGRS